MEDRRTIDRQGRVDAADRVERIVAKYTESLRTLARTRENLLITKSHHDQHLKNLWNAYEGVKEIGLKLEMPDWVDDGEVK